MTPLFVKLNLSNHTTVCVLDAPASFEPALAALSGVQIMRDVVPGILFAIAFCSRTAERDAASTRLAQAAGPDAVLWIAYPKQSSKRHRCEFNRDAGWDVLGQAGYEPVRQVAIDEDWSALRFRQAEHIRTMTRHPAGAISALGRRKTARAAA
jgi:hypothetical protein